MAVPFPLLAVVAHVVVHAPFTLEIRLPLESEIDVLGVMCGLCRDIDDAILARDRRRFDTAALDDHIAEVLLVALVAARARLALLDQPRPPVLGAGQPIVS